MALVRYRGQLSDALADHTVVIDGGVCVRSDLAVPVERAPSAGRRENTR